MQSIQEVAFARAVCPDQEAELAQVYMAITDTFVIAKYDATDTGMWHN